MMHPITVFSTTAVALLVNSASAAFEIENISTTAGGKTITTANINFLISRGGSTVDEWLENDLDLPWEPRTELGRKIVELRSNAIRKGMKLLSMDEINASIEDSRNRTI